MSSGNKKGLTWLRNKDIKLNFSSVEHRPKLTSQIVKSHVNLSIKTNVQGERRHVLQSAANKKMIISVVNTFEGGGRRF